MNHMVRNYLVRVSQRVDAADDDISGVVELIGAHGQRPFRSKDQLWSILAAAVPAQAQPRGPGRERR